MNATETAQLVQVITGYWNASDQRAIGMVRWLGDRGVGMADARNALTELADQYDTLPSIKQLGVKLAELGASTRSELGVGARPVVERFKAEALRWARVIADRSQLTLNERLSQERDAVLGYYTEAVETGLGDEAIGYWRDQLTAYDELLPETRETAR